MGLDTTWYRGLKKREDVVFDGEGEPTNVENYYRPHVNSEFPGREDGLENRAVYEYVDAGEGVHVGYGGHFFWREWLAKLAGYPATPHEQYGKVDHLHMAAAWYGKVTDGTPFYELINFSDCEGVIGSKVAAKLAKDFAEWDDRAKAAAGEDSREYRLYKRWRESFEQAQHNGAVDFH